MSTRTYKDYKEFFEKVNEENDKKNYHHSYILLFSFLENRIQRLFVEQLKHRSGRSDLKVKKDANRQSLFWKLKKIDSWGLVIPKSIIENISNLSMKRNEWVHRALFNVINVTKKDVDELYEICRTINKIREKQKKNPKKLEESMKVKKSIEDKRKALRLTFGRGLPKF